MIGKGNFQKKIGDFPYEKASVCLGLCQRVTLSRDRKNDRCAGKQRAHWNQRDERLDRCVIHNFAGPSIHGPVVIQPET